QVLFVLLGGRWQIRCMCVWSVGVLSSDLGVVSLLGLGGSSVVLDRSGRGLMVSGSPFSPGVFGLSASFVGDPVFDGSGVSRSLVIGWSAVVATMARLLVRVGAWLQGEGVVLTVMVGAGASSG